MNFIKAIIKTSAVSLVTLASVQSAMARDPSDYVQCDGLPRGMSSGEAAGRGLLALGTLGMSGLFTGAPEQANGAARLFGKDGVSACDRALNEERGKTDDNRRGRLLLFRIIHELEAKDNVTALAQALSFNQDSGNFINEDNYIRSYGVSALELQAIALTRLGRAAEAEAPALKMAALGPYDAHTLGRASHYLSSALPLTPEKIAFYKNLMKQAPEYQGSYATVLELHGKFDEAADRLSAQRSFSKPDAPTALLDAHTAIAYYLAHKPVQGSSYLAKAQTDNDKFAVIVQGLNATLMPTGQQILANGDEMIAFAKTLDLAEKGKMSEARASFVSHPRWLAVPAYTVSAAIKLLVVGAKPAEISGPLAQDPTVLMENYENNRIKQYDDEKYPLSTVNIFYEDKMYADIGAHVRVQDFKRYMPVKQDTDIGELINITDGYGAPQSEALTLLSAYVAKYRGKASFTFVPNRTADKWARVVFDPPEVTGMPADCYYNADAVIHDLEPRFPAPAK